jgi:hypothetical protein
MDVALHGDPYALKLEIFRQVPERDAPGEDAAALVCERWHIVQGLAIAP